MLKKSVFLLFITLSVFSCKTNKSLSTVSTLDLEKYIGTWHEIARFDHSFERNLSCVSATYSIKPDGNIKVENKGFNTKKNKWKTAIGKAKVPNTDVPGEIKVSFFGPFYGDYFVMKLDANYKHVLVGSPTRDYLWILSRDKIMPDDVYGQYLEIAKSNGFDISKLQLIDQSCSD
ncbi:lipocalin family protein [Flavobacteriales bacterium]|jgi:apolipoprotein D and lipocalin family protein|nr:lipocalin family protein [Flavobacteriales bacterium]MDC1370243.1 lipocalin family protein [Flavobacteriales bacterium]